MTPRSLEEFVGGIRQAEAFDALEVRFKNIIAILVGMKQYGRAEVIGRLKAANSQKGVAIIAISRIGKGAWASRKELWTVTVTPTEMTD